MADVSKNGGLDLTSTREWSGVDSVCGSPHPNDNVTKPDITSATGVANPVEEGILNRKRDGTLEWLFKSLLRRCHDDIL